MQFTNLDNILLIYSDPLPLIFNTNHFIGLTAFNIVNNSLIYDCQIINSQMGIAMKQVTNRLHGYIIVVGHKFC